MLPYNGYAHESEPVSTAPASSSKKAVTPVHKYHYQARFSDPLKRLLGDLGKQGDFSMDAIAYGLPFLQQCCKRGFDSTVLNATFDCRSTVCCNG